MKILSPIKKALFSHKNTVINQFFLNRTYLFSIFLIMLFLPKPAFSWSGYDYDKKTEIEITEGNLVRENEIIQFYDLKDDNFHSAKVTFVEENNGGTRIQVEDLDKKIDRIFIMEQ